MYKNTYFCNFIANKFFLRATEEGISQSLETVICLLILHFYVYYLCWLLFSLSVSAHHFWLLFIFISIYKF